VNDFVPITPTPTVQAIDNCDHLIDVHIPYTFTDDLQQLIQPIQSAIGAVCSLTKQSLNITEHDILLTLQQTKRELLEASSATASTSDATSSCQPLASRQQREQPGHLAFQNNQVIYYGLQLDSESTQALCSAVESVADANTLTRYAQRNEHPHITLIHRKHLAGGECPLDVITKVLAICEKIEGQKISIKATKLVCSFDIGVVVVEGNNQTQWGNQQHGLPCCNAIPHITYLLKDDSVPPKLANGLLESVLVRQYRRTDVRTFDLNLELTGTVTAVLGWK
jgi:hypothetical protein